MALAVHGPGAGVTPEEETARDAVVVGVHEGPGGVVSVPLLGVREVGSAGKGVVEEVVGVGGRLPRAVVGPGDRRVRVDVSEVGPVGSEVSRMLKDGPFDTPRRDTGGEDGWTGVVPFPHYRSPVPLWSVDGVTELKERVSGTRSSLVPPEPISLIPPSPETGRLERGGGPRSPGG